MTGRLFLLLLVAVMVALAAAFVVLLLKKWGIAEWYQVHGDGFTSRLFSCDLCMSFWVSFVMACTVAAVTGDWVFYSVPVFSTPISRMLV